MQDKLRDRHVVLIGPMGAGKSTVGRYLARELDRLFYDSDSEIETRTGVSIELIFDIEGEQGFRDRESAMLRDLFECAPAVIATGGGSVIRDENRHLMAEHGFVVYLKADLDLQFERTRNAKNRPKLNGEDKRSILEDLMLEREPLYLAAADLVCEVDRRSPQQMAKKLSREIDS